MFGFFFGSLASAEITSVCALIVFAAVALIASAR